MAASCPNRRQSVGDIWRSPSTASLLISMLLSECAAMSLGGSLTFAMQYRTIGQVKRDGVANVSAEERHRCSTSQALAGAL
jgi:hypothetical protein